MSIARAPTITLLGFMWLHCVLCERSELFFLKKWNTYNLDMSHIKIICISKTSKRQTCSVIDLPSALVQESYHYATKPPS
jgi:hypothetical protein